MSGDLKRSVQFVLLGTFTLRFSTGLAGGLLALFLARLPEHGGPHVLPIVAGIVGATYFAAELTLSPIFGVLADRLGAHRVMQWGPIFGVAAVLMRGVTPAAVEIGILVAFWIFIWLGITRFLEGAAAGSSIPSILGYIALATSGDEQVRGRAVARFEAATLAGLGVGLAAAGQLYDLMGANAFFINAALYAIAYAVYRWGVAEIPGSEPKHERDAADRYSWASYREALSGSRVLLLAPTWIALNAVIGSWSSVSIFQLVSEPNPRFSDQVMNGGLSGTQLSIGVTVGLVIFFAGLLYWGNRFKAYRRTTIIGVGIVGGLAMMGAVFALNHSQGFGLVLVVPLVGVLVAGLFVLAGATPAALGLLADMTETHPNDRGAVMGLYSVFLGIGQIIGALIGGATAQWRGIDGLLLGSFVLLLIAVLPLRGLRANEHLVGTAAPRT
ncbi:MAG TPA: MFS transporter [Candidatus Limnocylindria bacterium]